MVLALNRQFHVLNTNYHNIVGSFTYSAGYVGNCYNSSNKINKNNNNNIRFIDNRKRNFYSSTLTINKNGSIRSPLVFKTTSTSSFTLSKFISNCDFPLLNKYYYYAPPTSNHHHHANAFGTICIQQQGSLLLFRKSFSSTSKLFNFPPVYYYWKVRLLMGNDGATGSPILVGGTYASCLLTLQTTLFIHVLVVRICKKGSL